MDEVNRGTLDFISTNAMLLQGQMLAKECELRSPEQNVDVAYTSLTEQFYLGWPVGQYCEVHPFL